MRDSRSACVSAGAGAAGGKAVVEADCIVGREYSVRIEHCVIIGLTWPCSVLDRLGIRSILKRDASWIIWGSTSSIINNLT
jgi:hypothetical protein